MNQAMMDVLRLSRKAYLKLFPLQPYTPSFNYTGQAASDAIKAALLSSEPKMIARFGSLEINCVETYRNKTQNRNNCLAFIQGKTNPSWWDPVIIEMTMGNTPGFFPLKNDLLEKFAEMMIDNMKQVDILGSWVPAEKSFQSELAQCIKVPLTDLEPYYHARPWSMALQGKKVLVVHPFVKTIEKQYQNRQSLFANLDVLPEFELKTVQAVQSVAGNKTPYTTWFDALDDMKQQIIAVDFDIALIGCGAYGFPLAAHIKRLGKKVVHLGGATQILFGIKGKRWEREAPAVMKLVNDHWVRPDNVEVPPTSQKAEHGAYW